MHSKEHQFIPRPLSPIRKAIARRVSSSIHEVPQFDVHAEADATALAESRARYKSEGGEIVPGYTDMIIYCSSRVLEKHKRLNAHYTEEEIKEFTEINIGFAVATPQGVLLPVIRKANAKSLREISGETRGMSRLAVEMKLRASLQMNGTFTVSSLGGFGIDAFNAIINPPQVAILAAGSIIQKPRVKNGNIEAVPVLHLTLTVDHRVVDGADAAEFLADLKYSLENFNV